MEKGNIYLLAVVLVILTSGIASAVPISASPDTLYLTLQNGSFVTPYNVRYTGGDTDTNQLSFDIWGYQNDTVSVPGQTQGFNSWWTFDANILSVVDNDINLGQIGLVSGDQTYRISGGTWAHGAMRLDYDCPICDQYGDPNIPQNVTFTFSSTPTFLVFNAFNANGERMDFTWESSGPPQQSVPEPGTMLLLGFGSIGVICFRYRKWYSH